MRTRVVLFGTALALVVAATAARAQTEQRPITDFTSVQPSAQGWFQPITNNNIVYDAFGKWNAQFNLGLNTQLGGELAVHDQGDGTQRVLLVLHTKDALCYGFNPAGLAFGRTLPEVRAGAAASVGDALFRFEFTMPTGGAMPIWNAVLNAAHDAMATASISCKGELRTNSITGYADGQAGFAQTTQTGLYDTGAPDGCPPEQDGNCFPAEKVQFKATGKRN